MHITLTISRPETDDNEPELLSLDVYPEMTVETLRSSVQAETSIHPDAQHLYHNGELITGNSKTLQELQVVDGDMLALHVREMRGATMAPSQSGPSAAGRAGAGRSAGPARQDPELVRLQVLGQPALQHQLSEQNPALAAAINDPQRFAQLYTELFDRDRRERAERQRQMQLLNEDPFDPEAQAKIAEIIRQERVTENLQNAMEHNPEMFGRVHMLYIDVEVNGHLVKALVDSGAQATIMSPGCAEATGVMRLVDKRFAGVARGVGTAAIIGRVHSAQIKLGTLFLPCSFTVMEGKAVDLLLGLDMLKRHQMVIDLAKDKLIVQGVEIPFLGEADIPKESEEAMTQEPVVPGPGGTMVGQRSGVVSGPEDPVGQAQPVGQVAPVAGPSGAQPSPAPSAPQSRPVPPIPAGAPAPTRPQFPEQHVEQLMALGASRERAIQALEATGGNVEYAAGLIFDD